MQIFFGAPASAAGSGEALPANGVFRVLICRLTHTLGNTLLLTPLIREIETTYPGAEIDIFGGHASAGEILGTRRSVKTIYRLPAHAFRHPGQFLGLLRRVRRVNYDLVIDPCPRSQTGRLMLLLAKGRFKLGFAHGFKSGAITHAVPLPVTTRHVGQIPVALFRAAVGRAERAAYPTLDICISRAGRQRGIEMLRELTSSSPGADAGKGVIGIFANATGPKRLDPDWWRRFLTVLEAHKKDYSIVEMVSMNGESLLGSRYPAYYSSSIDRLSGVLSGLSLFISADCGVMHLACASGTPTIGIFTATDPAEWGPYGPDDRVIDARTLTPEQVALQAIA
jgi:heptosyltransferase III